MISSYIRMIYLGACAYFYSGVISYEIKNDWLKKNNIPHANRANCITPSVYYILTTSEPTPCDVYDFQTQQQHTLINSLIASNKNAFTIPNNIVVDDYFKRLIIRNGYNYDECVNVAIKKCKPGH